MKDRAMFNFTAMSKFQHMISESSLSTQMGLHTQLHCNQAPLAGTAVPVYMSRFKGGERRAHFGGLMMCKNAWSCPICSSLRIVEYRERITQVCETMNLNDYWGLMITLTVPHSRKNSAAEIIKLLFDARKSFNAAGFYKLTRSAAGGKKIYSFTATECKYSRAFGWHFHQHVLLFVPKATWVYLTRDDVINKLQEYWARAIGRFDIGDAEVDPGALHVSKDRIVNGDYIAKEMCKGTNGKSKNQFSCAPVDLLLSKDPRDNDLYMEFALATKGYHRFHGSAGLWNFTDTAIVKKNVREQNGYCDTVVVASFTFDGWNEIVQDEFENGVPHRINILRRAEFDGGSGVIDYCYENLLPLPLVYAKPLRTWNGGDYNETAAARRHPMSGKILSARAFKRARDRYLRLAI